MIKKILFIEPRAPNLHIFSAFAIPRLGSILLATIAGEKGYECKVIIEDIEKLNLNLIKDYDLIAISLITPTAPRGYAIADFVRESGKMVILGGPHVTFCVEEALCHADYVISGEGEIPFSKYLDAMNGLISTSEVPNLSFIENDQIFHNQLCGCVQDLDQLPHPDFNLVYKYVTGLSKSRVIPIQTSRGCPYDCSFCSVTAMFGKKYRKYTVDYVIDEVMPYNKDPNNFIFFNDDHFTADKYRTRELLEKLQQNNFRLKWSAQVRADIAKDEELLRMMKKAGCVKLFIGFESINPESLKSMHKNQTRDEIEQSIKIIKKNHIAIHGMFVFGFDEDTKDTLKQTIKFAGRYNLESVQFLILTPFPGTATHKKLVEQNRILIKDWSLYDTHHVVFKPKNLSLIELQIAQIKGHKKFYSDIRLLKNIVRFKFDNIAITLYAKRINRVWKKLNKPYLKLMNLIKSSKSFEISAAIRQRNDINSEGISKMI